MDHKNDPTEGAAKMLLERLKSNGTFDEFRRHCASDIDAKPTFLNLKQRIESNSFKFLSKIKYTPELNKNIVRERLKKYLFDGREAHDIEEGIDRILNQVLAPRMVNVFEPKIEIAVNEYLGIKNEVPLTEVNGIKESNMNLKNGSDVERHIISNQIIDLTLDTENIDNIDETSPEFEPLSSVLDNENSNDESISGMSDLVSVGSPIQLVTKENHENTSNGFENDKNIVDKPQHIDKNGIINHKNTKPDDVKISSNIEKLKTNDSKPKSKHSLSRTSRHSSSQEKSSIHKSKDRNSSSHRSTSQEKNDIKKSISSNSKDRKNSSHRHRSDSKDKKHKRDKKSNQSDRDKTPKRDRKNSRSDKKEKSSSLCKEPKSLNGNRSDDESNAGGSSKQKSNLHKNKSSTSDKSKSSSSHHKSSRKDNGSKDVVDKSKDKSSISKTSSSSNYKSNRTHSKKRKRSLNNDSTSPESNPIEEKKPKWSDFMTNAEKDAANVLLSMSKISYESSHNEIITENIIFVDNYFSDDTLKTTSNTTGNTLENQDNINQRKDVQFSDNNSVEENFNLKTPEPSVESVDNVNEKCIPPINHVAEEVCSVDAESPILLPCKDVAAQNTSFENVKITSEPNKPIELEVPKLKLKLLQSNRNFLNHEKKRKHHKNHKSKEKKLRLSCYSSNDVSVPVIDNVSTTINSEQDNQKSICDIDIKRNDNLITPLSQETLSLPKENEIKNTQPLENNESLYTFKGFSESEAIPCKNYEKLRDLLITLKESLANENIESITDNDGFKGFTCEELHPCENRDLVNLQLNKLTEEVGFKGFSEKETQMSSEHKLLKQQLELYKKQNNTNNKQSSVTCSGSGIKNEKSFKKVMSIIYESNKDGILTPKKICTKPVIIKKKSPVVNNNNHDITASNDWVAKQEMKYKLLPVKVKLERLMEYRYNETKRIPDSPQVS